VSIYHYDFCSSTWEAFKNFKGGRAIFTQPATPIKCAGAPQKIMWLFEEYVKDKKMRQDTEVGFWIPGAAMFGVDKYSRKLTDLAQERDVDVRYKQELIKIDR
jgi:sulfide:quinone oxidoreductase